MKVWHVMIFSLILSGCGDSKIITTTEEKVYNVGFAIAEESYYEGQKDAIEGRIRIKKTNRGNYVWIESPWDSGREPSFHPPVKTEDVEKISPWE